MELTNVELTHIEGGGFKLSVGKGLVIGGVISFLIGVVDGFFRPLSCSAK